MVSSCWPGARATTLTYRDPSADACVMIDAKPDAKRHSAIAFVLATLARISLMAALLASEIFGGGTANARVISVGPGQLLNIPSQAATVAQDGDHILIHPATYRDCAVWRAARLTIEAAGPGVTIGDKVCAGRGIFVTVGHDITIRGITLVHARTQYHTGAGIFAFGDNLTVEDSRFLDNENGILAGGSAESRVHIRNSEFRGNGSCEGACAHAVYAGAPIALLDIEHCRFRDTRTAHHVKSRARTTMVVDNDIADEDTGTASYLIETPNGGNLLVQGNVLQKGARSSNPAAAISIGVEGVTNPTNVLIVRDNRFVSDLPEPTIFVRNSTRVTVDLAGNQLSGKVIPQYKPTKADGINRNAPE